MAHVEEMLVNGVPTPVTVFDHTAQEIDDAVDAVKSGGSGGASSWNDLADKPFGDNEDGSVKQLDNRFLAILEKTAETEIVSERELSFVYHDDTNGTPLYTCEHDPQIALQEDKNYVVELGGKKYYLTAKYYTGDLVQACYLGNLALATSEMADMDTGEDLLIMWGEGETNLIITTSREGETQTFRITQVTYKIKEEYLPEATGAGGSENAEGSGLPAVTTADNDKILQVVNGEWKVVALADSAVKTYIDGYINEALGGEY